MYKDFYAQSSFEDQYSCDQVDQLKDRLQDAHYRLSDAAVSFTAILDMLSSLLPLDVLELHHEISQLAASLDAKYVHAELNIERKGVRKQLDLAQAWAQWNNQYLSTMA